MDVISNETGESTRPTRFDLAVRQAAAVKAWPVFRAWLIRSGASETEADADRENVLPELAAALEWNDNGYDVAKHLEGRGWDADDDLGSGRVVTGQVTQVDATRAKYVVFCASLGHVREGVGSHGTYVNFEDVTAASA